MFFKCYYSAGAENLWPAWTFNMACIRIFVTQCSIQHRMWKWNLMQIPRH